ncbi:MAG: class A beta-lactamase [Hyphomicrobiales bacterium]|nr:class A beta-lactamase [Hyphomicrobiales bacterium]
MFIAGIAASLAPLHARAADPLDAAAARIAALEARAGGRLGVCVSEAKSGRRLAHRADERFPMCSTFKALAAAAILARVDKGAERLDRRIAYGPADLLEYAPVAKAHAGEGAMALGDLCAAAIDWSDNTAANLMLRAIGGPAEFTRYIRSIGDSVTRLDRDEPTLNAAVPGDERDTTTPLAMARDLEAVLLGDALSEASRRQLETWMIGDKVGDRRLRAGVPASWGVGDKTGSGDNGTANTIAILRPPGRAPLLAAVYYTQSDAPTEARNAVHRDVGAIIGEAFGG